MFLSADILVKAVMIGLAFASLVTWTIFIAKMIELSLVQRRLRAALGKIGDARSLAEAQFALGAKDSVLSSLLAAAMREARLSAGISSDAGIKERAASSFAEIVRAEARRIRLGMGVLATIGATSPFVGLFGTVWGIMNSFIGISKSQTTNLAVVAPGHRRSAARHRASASSRRSRPSSSTTTFRGSTKGYLELVGRASGAAARLLSRDLDRTHVVAGNAIARGGVGHGRFDLRSDLDDDNDFAETHEINVTPFIDVILVLLIIFMVAAPLSTVDLPVDLPSSTAAPQKKPDKPTYSRSSRISRWRSGENPVKRTDLVSHARRDGGCEQGPLHLPARRSRGALWRDDGRAGDPARRRLFEDQAGRAGRRSERGLFSAGKSKT